MLFDPSTCAATDDELEDSLPPPLGSGRSLDDDDEDNPPEKPGAVPSTVPSPLSTPPVEDDEAGLVLPGASTAKYRGSTTIATTPIATTASAAHVLVDTPATFNTGGFCAPDCAGYGRTRLWRAEGKCMARRCVVWYEECAFIIARSHA